jgi:hypothetical protein
VDDLVAPGGLIPPHPKVGAAPSAEFERCRGSPRAARVGPARRWLFLLPRLCGLSVGSEVHRGPGWFGSFEGGLYGHPSRPSEPQPGIELHVGHPGPYIQLSCSLRDLEVELHGDGLFGVDEGSWLDTDRFIGGERPHEGVAGSMQQEHSRASIRAKNV